MRNGLMMSPRCFDQYPQGVHCSTMRGMYHVAFNAVIHVCKRNPARLTKVSSLGPCKEPPGWACSKPG